MEDKDSYFTCLFCSGMKSAIKRLPKSLIYIYKPLTMFSNPDSKINIKTMEASSSIMYFNDLH